MTTSNAALSSFILEVFSMSEDPNNGVIAKALLAQFEAHHQVMCGMVQGRLTGVETDVKANTEEIAQLRGGVKLLMWLLPILCTLGSALGALLIRGAKP